MKENSLYYNLPSSFRRMFSYKLRYKLTKMKSITKISLHACGIMYRKTFSLCKLLGDLNTWVSIQRVNKKLTEKSKITYMVICEYADLSLTLCCPQFTGFLLCHLNIPQLQEPQLRNTTEMLGQFTYSSAQWIAG